MKGRCTASDKNVACDYCWEPNYLKNEPTQCIFIERPDYFPLLETKSVLNHIFFIFLNFSAIISKFFVLHGIFERKNSIKLRINLKYIHLILMCSPNPFLFPSQRD